MNLVQKWLDGFKLKLKDSEQLPDNVAQQVSNNLKHKTKVQEDSLDLQAALKVAIKTVARPTNPEQGSNVIVLDENTSVIIGQEEWIDHVLSCDPVEGDIGGTEPLEDRIVKVRSSKKLCTWCLSPRLPNTYSRVMTWYEEGEWIHHHYCQDCCNAFIQNDYGHDRNGLPEHHELYDDEGSDMQWDVRDEVRKKNESLLKGHEDDPDVVKYELLKGEIYASIMSNWSTKSNV